MAAPAQIGPISARGAGGPTGAFPLRLGGPKPKPVAGAPKVGGRINSFAELSIPLAVLGIVWAMIMPMPSFLLDILISSNITISVIYGAMDGACRFTQRDAVASILITTINLVAGFLIGVFQHGMDLQRALATYTVLTIGDGLVTVIPALMVSVYGALIVTRASSDNQLGTEMRRQIFSNPQPLILAGGVLVALAAFPGLPTIPFLLLGSGVGFVGWNLRYKAPAGGKTVPSAVSASARESLETVLKMDPLAVEVGLGLVRRVEGEQSSPLLRRIAGIRKQMASDAGYLVPPVRVSDNLQLKAGEYVVLLKGAEIARFEMIPNCELAIHAATGAAAKTLEGIATRGPAFAIPALWVSMERAEVARAPGCTVVDTVSVIGTHFTELIKAVAAAGGVFDAPQPSTQMLSDDVADLRCQTARLTESLLSAQTRRLGAATPEQQALRSRLLDAELDPDLAEQVALGASLDDLFRVDATLGRPGASRAVVALVGPPGAGKTTTLVKLAAQYGLASRRPAQIVSADVFRIAAADQLRSLASILGIGCTIAQTPVALAQALEEHRGKDYVFIDTPGLGRDDMQDGADLARLMAAHPEIDTHLVLPASMRPVDVSDVIDRYQPFRPAKLLFTRRDETGRFGALVNESARRTLPISFLAMEQQIPDDLEPATKHKLSALVRGDAPVEPRSMRATA